MSSIRSRDTTIEKIVKNILVSLNADMEEHPKDIYGNPDFILREKRVAIFCDGDFWHGYEMRTNPRLNIKRNRAFWLKKISSNAERDKKVNTKLSQDGWAVVRLWEHNIKSNKEKCAEIIKLAMTGDLAWAAQLL